VLVNGTEEAKVVVSLRMLRRGPTVVAAHDIPAGAAISEADLNTVEQAIPQGPAVLSSVSDVVGQTALGPIKGGTLLTAIMLKPELIVKRGTRVVMVCRSKAFTVSAAGEALQDGCKGQIIKVKNASSGLELSGRVIGPEMIEV